MSPRKRIRQTSDYILLGLLSQQPMHGYELYKEMTRLEGIGMVWRIRQSLLYALLDKLEGEGLLSSQLVPGETHPDRKEFHLTDAGKSLYLDWANTPVQRGREMRQDFLARLYFARSNNIQNGFDLLDKQEVACQSWLQTFQKQYSQLDETQLYEKLVLQFRIQQTGAMLEWIQTCRQQFSEGEA